MSNNRKMPVAHSYEPDIFNSNSAEIIVPILLNKFNIKSVVDIGCGPAYWLSVFEEAGICDYMGIDSEYVDLSDLLIAKDKFMIANLEDFKIPTRRFDLCLSLEVAEHLSESVADSFVKKLTELSDIVLFSSAIPGQTGQHHVNLQWPDYWADKFNKHGYKCCDIIRPLIWGNEKVNWWYQQNVLLFVNSEIVTDLEFCVPEPMVHIRQYEKVLERLERYQEFDKRSLFEKIKGRLL